MGNCATFNRKSLVLMVWTGGFSLPILLHILAPLGNYPPLGSDEGWIMSAGYKLSTSGVFGSDWYRGFYNADHAYFIALPVQHFLIAAAFRLFGEGIASARGVSVVSWLVLICAVTYLAWRWYGLGTALVTVPLLTIWRSFLGGDALGLALLSPARSARYDMSAVALFWLTLLLLDAYLRAPRARTAFGVGFTAGAATLTQFFGISALAVVAGVCLWHRRSKLFDKANLAWLAWGFLVLILPYAIYVGLNGDAFVKQTDALKHSRIEFTDAGFYLANVGREIQRYSDVSARAFGDGGMVSRGTALLSFAGIAAGLLNLLRRVRVRCEPSQMLLPWSIVMPALGLVLFESTKAPLYTIILYPSLCVALALFWRDVYGWRREGWYRAAIIVSSVVILGSMGVKAFGAFQADQEAAVRASRYVETLRQVRSALPERANILTSDRMAWGLRDLTPLSSNNLAMQLEGMGDDAGGSLRETVAREQIEYFVLDEEAFVDFATSERLNAELRDFVTHCAEDTAVQKDFSYGAIQVHRVNTQRPGCAP